ncbi:anti-sigma regulatory factor [Streptomyces sp. HUCO-GS316]|uniref:anti-sigma regulatory factor n=1 Tax=Streptomyces sp. HUCO-GS316 TaxID=2692198 RepID=UPI00136D9B1D|nr:anti-sigma regulatory factor [Streptomyces sp. HUCO-GS316]MXM64721.1 anti-sigma regulatory factor [Streptomyces sp. HUCO-GS316]
MTVEAVTGREPAVFDIVDESDLIRVRKVLRTEAEATGLNLVDTTKLITAGSELARNILNYATGGRGRVSIEQVSRQGRRGVQATFCDDGPGIDDVDLAMTDGFSTRGSMGLGLPGARRLVDDMTLTSAAGRGTTVVIVKWQR